VKNGPRSVLDWIALAVTYVVNPFILPPLFLLLVMPGGEAASTMERTFMVAAACYFLLPVAILIVLRWRGHVNSIEVRTREKRTLPYIAAIALSVLAIPGIWLASGRNGGLAAIFALFGVNLVLLFLINRHVKISVHAAGIGGFAALAWFVVAIGFGVAADHTTLSATHALFFTALVPLVGWSRVRLGAHSTHEVLLGAAFGFWITIGELLLLRVLGV
jgi:hypothetical protein